MQVRIIDKEKPEFTLADESSWRLFEEVAAAIQEAFGGRWVEQVDGLDQRYWDLQLEHALVTLHLEHYLGISLFPSEASPNQVASSDLVRRIARFLSTYEPAA